MSCWKDGLFLPHSEDIPSGFWGFPDPTCRGLTSSGRLGRPQHSWVFLAAEVKLSNLGDNEVGEDEDLTTLRLAGRQSQPKVTTAGQGHSKVRTLPSQQAVARAVLSTQGELGLS